MTEIRKEKIIAKSICFAKASLTFAKTFQFLGKSQWWPKERLEEYQLKHLKSLLEHAYQNVPYYRKEWVKLNFHPDELKAIDDIKRLPFTTKAIFQENFGALRAGNFRPDDLAYARTGGSSGIPFGFYEERYIAAAREAAFIFRLWHRAGFRPGDKRIVLRGKIIPGSEHGKLAKYDPIKRQLSLSSYHLTEENISHYLKLIAEFKAPFIHAYPSLIIILGNYMRENQVRPFSFLKAILAGSENLYDWQRELLEEVFNCRVYNWYGHTEKAVLAGGCENENCYHIFPEYGITELVDSSGNEIREEGQIGEIVATGFNNLAMPFIRYRTGDLGVYTGKQCSCGRNYAILKKIEGRLQEYVVGNDGSLISLTSLVFAQHFDAFSRIRQMQIHQNTEGKITVTISGMPEYSRRDEEEVRKTMHTAASGKIDVSFNYVDDIPRTKSGKSRLLVQELAVGKGD